MHAEDRRQLDRVTALLRDVLGPDLLGAYLFGSAVLGGLRRRSDLDVLAVSRRRTTREEKQRLADRLLAISGRTTPRGTWRRVELTLVAEADVRPWRYPPAIDFQYGDWLRGQFERGDVEPLPTRIHTDVAPLLTMVLLADTPVLGPPPGEVLDPVPHGDLLRAITDDLESVLERLDGDTRNAVLTLARIWTTVATGRIRSKDAAAEWALPRLPREHRAVLARARAVYRDEEEERWDDLRTRVRPYADHVVDAIRGLARPADP